MDFCLLLELQEKMLVKYSENLSGKYSQKLFEYVKKSATDTFKTASKRAIQKTAETTGDMIEN